MSPVRQGPVLLAVGDPEGDKAVNYLRALEHAGVPAERVRVVQPEEGRDDRRMGREAAGLVLAGGDDVDPSLYGEEAIPEAENVIDAARDAMELALLEGARDEEVPVWGVCRGIQVLNVFLGGTLYQDLALQLPTQVLHRTSNPSDALIHPVMIDPAHAGAGVVERTLAREVPLVNSRHHQGIKDLAPGLVAVGRSPDALVEATYLADPATGRPASWWVRAVQWHPENLIAMAQQRALWGAFREVLGLPAPPAPPRAAAVSAALAEEMEMAAERQEEVTG